MESFKSSLSPFSHSSLALFDVLQPSFSLVERDNERGDITVKILQVVREQLNNDEITHKHEQVNKNALILEKAAMPPRFVLEEFRGIGARVRVILAAIVVGPRQIIKSRARVRSLP